MMDCKHQGKGIGTLIIGECLDALREMGCESVELGVDKGNPQSFGFWKKNGFQVVEEDAYIRMAYKF